MFKKFPLFFRILFYLLITAFLDFNGNLKNLEKKIYFKKLFMYQTILTHTEQGICTITINRSDKMNALNKDVIQELGAALEAARLDAAVQALILTGAGEKAFVAGADITEFTELQAAGGKALATVGAELVFNKIKGVQKENQTVDIESFIAVKGFKALGNQLTTDKLKQVNLLEPLPYEEPEEVIPEESEVAIYNEISDEDIQSDEDGQITLF